jgi:3-methyl-2-oxobutanoate hydroxymethyltransferase
MSTGQSSPDKLTTVRIVRKKAKAERIVCLTAYDFPTARILDEAGVELILVGDSAANVIYGMPTTLTIGMDEMVFHTKAVAAGVKRALVVADMPFLSYQVSVEQAVANAGRFLQAGAEAVKVEGAGPVVPAVKRLVELGIPVMGHLGLTPQSVHKLGGYRLQARKAADQEKLLADAHALADAGCFSVVLEKVPAEVAKRVTAELPIPTIGIGAGPDCDGQVLVLHDMLGMSDAPPLKFVKQYAQLYGEISRAVTAYAGEVRSGKFPSEEHTFHVPDEGAKGARGPGA